MKAVILSLLIASASAWPPSPSPSKPPPKTVTTYHLFERKYTGLANKDAGDFLGDASFIFMTFNPFEKENPEASMEENIIEMSTVTVHDWSTEYLACNAPGAVYNSSFGKRLDCPSTSADYCCTGNRSTLTAETLPAYKSKGNGYWFSFPKASEGKLWNEKLERRINGACIGNAWRKQAGGCPQCGSHLDQCVASCIQSALVTKSGHWPRYHYDYSKLQAKWDEAFKNKTLCPDQPLPGQEAPIILPAEEKVDWPPSPAPSKPPKTVTTYHLFERKYTGLANKDAGDFVGDASFIFLTFNPFEKENPEASMEENIIEMSTVTVKDWSTEYLACNAPGAVYNSSFGKKLNCPSTNADYCCTGNRSPVTAETLPAYKSASRGSAGSGYWFSFPKASEGKLWTEKMERRINGACIGNAWRKQAGGCPQCGSHLDQCVAGCIQTALVTKSGYWPRYKYDYSKLQAKWDEAFQNKTLCPEQPLPAPEGLIIV